MTYKRVDTLIPYVLGGALNTVTPVFSVTPGTIGV
jgi:hypothetical protein